MSGELMLTLSDIDKLDENFTFRLPECAKKQIDRLSPDLKKRLNMRLLLAVAEVLHESKFDPLAYLSTKEP